MKRQPCSRIVVGCLVVCLLTTEPGKTEPQQGTTRATQRRNYATMLLTIAKGLSEQYDCTILVDPDVALRSRPLSPGAYASVTDAITTLVTPHRDLACRRVYLPASDATPLPAKLAAWARSLDRVDIAGVAVEDRDKDRETLLLKDLPVDSGLTERWESAQGRRKPLYLLYSRSAAGDGKTAAERLADMEAEQLKLMERLGPEQRANPMLQTMALLQELEPAIMQEFVGRVSTAGGQSWERTPPDQRKEMIADAMKVGQTYAGRPGEAPKQRPSIRYITELKRIAQELGRKSGVKVVIDPAIYLVAQPAEPPQDAKLETALDEVVKPLEGVRWRMLLLPLRAGPEGGPISVAPGKLAQAVREMSTFEQKALALVDPNTRRATTFAQGQPALSALKRDEQGPAFSPDPVYLIYASDLTAPGSAELRYADLQRRQLEMMVQMSSEDLAQAMDQGIQRYLNQPADKRTSTMGLPMMAGMMAVWFPRAAKEGDRPR
jgi:hypothetical protein